MIEKKHGKQFWKLTMNSIYFRIMEKRIANIFNGYKYKGCIHDGVNGKDKVFFGIDKETKEKIYLTKPSWDCGWYWGFGYLGNKDCHYHLSGYSKGRNIDMYDALKNDYELNEKIERNLWEFCELVQTAYTLKEAAEVLGRGGSHYTNNPCKEIIKNEEEVKRINEIVLPAIFNKISELIES